MARIEGATGLQLEAPGVFSRCELPSLQAGADEVVVEVAGCGLCHTDVGFAYGGVPTRHAMPLILGPEISGRVVDAGDRAGGHSVRELRGVPGRAADHLPETVHARERWAWRIRHACRRSGARTLRR